VLGISFDAPEDNAAFRDKHSFPFRLLSDTTKTVGATYEVLRDAGDPFADYPKRISYLIDPDGMIAKSYEVSDPGGHGAEVLTDLEALQQ
jgi:peroxiredoxin Q/BCP